MITGMAVFMALTFGPLLNLTGTDTPSSDSTPSVSDPSVFKTVGGAPEHTPTPTVTPTSDPAPVVEAPAPQPVEEPPAATVDENGAVTGPGCPPPYVDLGYGCQSPICGVDENGNDIPCQ